MEIITNTVEQTIKFPIAIQESLLQVKINLKLYHNEAITASCYKFSGKYFVHKELDGDTVIVTLKSKEGNVVTEEVAMKFCNDLIDQQIRIDVNKKFGQIRDLIVEEAFKPVNAKK